MSMHSKYTTRRRTVENIANNYIGGVGYALIIIASILLIASWIKQLPGTFLIESRPSVVAIIEFLTGKMFTNNDSYPILVIFLFVVFVALAIVLPYYVGKVSRHFTDWVAASTPISLNLGYFSVSFYCLGILGFTTFLTSVNYTAQLADDTLTLNIFTALLYSAVTFLLQLLACRIGKFLRSM